MESIDSTYKYVLITIIVQYSVESTDHSIFSYQHA